MSGLAFLELLFPPKCVCCGEPVPPGDGLYAGLCGECLRDVSFVPKTACPLCGRGADCCECGRQSAGVSGLAAPFYYDGALRRAIDNYKFKKHRDCAAFFARATADAVRSRLVPQLIDAVVPVPLSASARTRRGFNQSELVARRMGRILKKPVIINALEKCVDNSQQHRLNAADRANNVLGVYRAGAHPVKNLRVLLIDDISTTGATLRECAKILRRAGAPTVWAAVIALTR